jgi:uncharacterized protein YprB with RNaseH-like and TPR domain
MIFLDLETTSVKADNGLLSTVGLILPNGEKKLLFANNPAEEKKIIEDTLAILRQYKNEPVVIWYSAFDIPFFATRAIKNKVDVSEIFSMQIIDLWKHVSEHLQLSSNRLEEVSKFLGVEKNIELSGKDMHILYINAVSGDEDAKRKIIAHCEDDLVSMKKIFEILKPYIDIWLRKNQNFK